MCFSECERAYSRVCLCFCVCVIACGVECVSVSDRVNVRILFL